MAFARSAQKSDMTTPTCTAVSAMRVVEPCSRMEPVVRIWRTREMR